MFGLGKKKAPSAATSFFIATSEEGVTSSTEAEWVSAMTGAPAYRNLDALILDLDPEFVGSDKVTYVKVTVEVVDEHGRSTGR